MSAIDFDVMMERLAHPKDGRLKITMSGRFLPFRYYSATGIRGRTGSGAVKHKRFRAPFNSTPALAAIILGLTM